MTRVLGALLLLAGLGLMLAGRPAPAEEKGDVVKLFNGKDLTGWKTYLGKAGVKPEDIWSVEDGVIICKGTTPGYLLTDKEYGDYVLRVQWRWGPKPGNSGVFVHVSGPDKIWPKGIEAQLASGQAGDFWLVDGYKLTVPKDRQDPNVDRHYLRKGETWKKLDGKDAKGRPKVEAVRKQVEKPVGEWNQYEITCKGDNIKLVVNGELVNEGTAAESSKGKILLQSEGAEIHFRNVELQPLK